MNPVSAALLKSGVLSDSMKEQFRQWGVQVDLPSEEPLAIESPEQVAAVIEAALQSEGLVLNRVTDLDMIKRYCETQRLGSLQLKMGDVSAEFQVSFGVTVSGDIILPWRSEDIYEAMVDPETVLRFKDKGQMMEISFMDVRDIFYGEVKAFMVCVPSTQSTLLQAGGSDGNIT